MAGSALPEVTALEDPRPLATAGRTAEALRPARGGEVVQARGLVGKAFRNSRIVRGKSGRPTRATVGVQPDATG